MASKMHAWGHNVMIRIANPAVSAGGIVLAGAAKKSFEPRGTVVSCGKLVTEANELINRKVEFDAGMERCHFGDPEKDEYIFVVVNEAGILAVALGDEEVVTQA